jgi:hypothetical protein
MFLGVMEQKSPLAGATTAQEVYDVGIDGNPGPTCPELPEPVWLVLEARTEVSLVLPLKVWTGAAPDQVRGLRILALDFHPRRIRRDVLVVFVDLAVTQLHEFAVNESDGTRNIFDDFFHMPSCEWRGPRTGSRYSPRVQ